jgi:hypothetical protein
MPLLEHSLQALSKALDAIYDSALETRSVGVKC